MPLARRPECTILVLLCALFITAPAQTQTPTASPKAADVLMQARKLYSQEGPGKALPEYERALALFQREGDRKGEAITIGLMGNAYKRMGQHEKALDHLQRSLAMKRQLGDRLEEGKTLSNLGLFYWETSDYPKAIESYNNASVIANELADRTLEAAIHNNLGLVYNELGEMRRAIQEFNRAMELYRGAEPSEAIANTIGNIGGQHLLLGEYADALRYYQQALEIDEKLQLKPAISLDLQNIGLAFTGLGRSQEAIQALDRAINLSHDAGLLKEESDSRKAKASALLQLGRYTDALEQYTLASQVYEKAGVGGEPQFKQNLVEALGDLGNLKIRLGDLVSAEKDFRRAIEVSEQIKHPRGVTTNLISLGDLQLRQKRFPEAAALYYQALTRANDSNDKANAAAAKIQLAHTLRNLKKFDDAERQAREAREISKAAQARPIEAEAMYALAEVDRSREHFANALTIFSEGSAIATELSNPELSWRFEFGRGQTLQSLNRNDEALEAFQNAVKTIETVRGELREERFRSGYIEDKYQVYISLVQLLLKLGRAEEAFVASERLRARSYLDLIERSQPPIRNQTQRHQELNFRSRIRELQNKLEEEAAKPVPQRRGSTVDLYSKELAAAEHDYQNFLDDIAKSEPSFASVRRLSVPTEDEVRKHLSSQTALIEYVLADKELVVFVLTSKGLRAKSIPARTEDLISRVETLRELILRNKTSEWKLPAAALYQTLIAPIESEGWLRDIKQIYLIPHTILHYVPFAVLHNGNQFLIDNYVVSYLPAAAALIHSDSTARQGTSILAMAPASSRLQYTQTESESISSFFPNQRTVLLGARATESKFKNLAGDYDLIHLATHGYFNKTNPLLSGLVLESDATEDGRLEVHEILGLRLRAKLVTLSACDTAVGSGYFSEVPPGDDLVGLTRAFLSTGTPSVLASLWKINDRSAVTFMNKFYSGLREQDKATALTVAQREMRSRGIYRHPYYWAAFVLVGQMK